MKRLLLSVLLLIGLHSANANAIAITANVSIDPGLVGSTLPGQTAFQLPDLVGIDIAANELTINVLLADDKLLGISGVINAILQVTTDPSGSFGGIELSLSAIFASDGSEKQIGLITNATAQTVNLFGGGPFDLASVRYGGLSGGGVITSASFSIHEDTVVKQAQVPIPTTLALVGLGLLVLSTRRRRG